MENIKSVVMTALNYPLFHQFLGFWGLLFLVVCFIQVARNQTVILKTLVVPCAYLSIAAILCYNFLLKGVL